MEDMSSNSQKNKYKWQTHKRYSALLVIKDIETKMRDHFCSYIGRDKNNW